MQEFNREFQKWCNPEHNNQAYKEFYRTKGLSAWNFEVQPKVKTLNQYYTLYTFPDDSQLRVSSGRNVIDLNSMDYRKNAKAPYTATRALFGCANRMPWESFDDWQQSEGAFCGVA